MESKLKDWEMYGKEFMDKRFRKAGGVVVVDGEGDGESIPLQSVCVLHGRMKSVHDAITDLPDIVRTATAQNRCGWALSIKGGLKVLRTENGREFYENDDGKPFFSSWTDGMVSLLMAAGGNG